MSQPTPYGQNPVTPAPVYRRPPLTSRQKRGAMLAGGIGFTLMTFGFTIVAAALAATLVVVAIGGIVSLIEGNGASTNYFVEGFTTIVRDFGWIVAVAAIVGVLIWIGGYFASVRILRSSGNPRPTAVTWAALGIAIAASWLIGSVLSVPAQLTGAFEDFDAGWGRAALAVSIGSGVIGIVTTIAVGVFAWWWMAHAMRAAPAVAHDEGVPAA